MKVLCTGIVGSESSPQGLGSQKKRAMLYNAQTFENEFKKEAKFLKQLSHPHIVKMVHAKVEDESLLASSMQALKLSELTDKKRERNRSGESSKSGGSSGGSSTDDKQGTLWIDVSQNKYIILEWAENGDLFDFTLGFQEPLGEQLARFYFFQILSAVEYLHTDQKIIHRDFKLENILVDSNFNLKICDFTLAKTIAEGSIVGVFYSNVGTERYMAPEIHEGKPYKGTTTDIFALGVILFVMVTGVMPFHTRASKTDPLYQYIYKNDEKGFWENIHKTYGVASSAGSTQSNFNPLFSEEFRKFIWPFFSYHYFERITLEKIKASKWILQHSQDGVSVTRDQVVKEMQRRKLLIDERGKQLPLSSHYKLTKA